MTLVLTALQYLGYILIFPGFLFCFLAGMLLTGIDRKLVAKMQKRVGPPVLQPFYDFFKLCGKETILPAAASKTVFLAAPLVGPSPAWRISSSSSTCCSSRPCP